jgi:hypothetical protein
VVGFWFVDVDQMAHNLCLVQVRSQTVTPPVIRKFENPLQTQTVSSPYTPTHPHPHPETTTTTPKMREIVHIQAGIVICLTLQDFLLLFRAHF